MDLKQIKELMTAMEKAGVKKIAIKEKTGFELQLEREDAFPPVQHHIAHPPMFVPHSAVRPHDLHHHHSPIAHHVVEEEKGKKEEKATKTEGKYVTSPMVGTLYTAPSPEDPAFVKVGDRVEEGTVICIIEAMKVMNEVKAGVSGVVAEVCLDNGHPVEFGTKLFRIV